LIVLLVGLGLEYFAQARAQYIKDAETSRMAMVAANAQERAASLEKEAAMARLELSRLTSPRTEKFDRDAFKAALRGKPKTKVELLFPPQDADSYFLCTVLRSCLAEEGWSALERVITEEDIPAGKINRQAPLVVRAGVGTGGVGLLASKPVGLRDDSDPVLTIISALNAGRSGGGDISSLVSIITTLPSIPDDVVRIVIGPRYHKW
jgi:hypothetical protein